MTKERRLGVDVLDSIVVIACLGHVAGAARRDPGAGACRSAASWCKRTEDNSKKLLLGAFGKQPRYCWLLQDGQEIQIALDKLQKGDIVVVHTGEVVPVDGMIAEGLAMIDQHALTGESTPAEKGVGDRVFASTIMVAGKMHVSVEKSGGETATAKIAQILHDTAGYKLASQHKGEQLADKAVIPTLAIGARGAGDDGAAGRGRGAEQRHGHRHPHGRAAGHAVDAGAVRAEGHPGEGRPRARLCATVDTVLFDKTGTLTRERPEVGRIIASNGHAPETILRFAAAAEHKFHHPIALAILQQAAEDGLELPETDTTQYKVGYGITVGIDGHRVRVGSRRFIEDGRRRADAGSRGGAGGGASRRPHHGHGGGGRRSSAARWNCAPAVRPGGARDHQGPARARHQAPRHHLRRPRGADARLAEQLGMDRYFAQVLPADKADYVEKLQKEGRKVCFVGDGINDAIALKKANVSISLRGATSIATDTAHVVFMEQSLGKLCELRDIARDLERNVAHQLGPDPGAEHRSASPACSRFGFGIAASVLTNNVAALAALANGVRPMRKVAALEAERRHMLDLQLRELGFGSAEGPAFGVPGNDAVVAFRANPGETPPPPAESLPDIPAADDATADAGEISVQQAAE